MGILGIQIVKKHKTLGNELGIVMKFRIMLAFFMAICYNKYENS